MAAQRDSNAGWDRLEAALTEVKPGDLVSIHELLEHTGLPRETIEAVLIELTRAQLFERRDDETFVRRSLWQQTG